MELANHRSPVKSTEFCFTRYRGSMSCYMGTQISFRDLLVTLTAIEARVKVKVVMTPKGI